MRYTPKDYARAFTPLWVEARSDKAKERLIQKLKEVIKKEHQEKEAQKILSEILQSMAKEEGGRLVLIETARPITEIRKKLGALLKNNDLIEEKINPSLLAGVRLTINGEEELDGSLKNKIGKLEAHLLKN